MRVTILGCGRWGSFLSWYLDSIGHDVFLWGRETSKRLERLRLTRQNDEVSLHDGIEVSSDLKEALRFADVIIVSISSQHLRGLMLELAGYELDNRTIVLCMKGLEEHTGKRLTQIVAEHVPAQTQTAIWVGPGHVQDFMCGIPNCMVIDSECDETKHTLIRAFSSDLIRFYYGNDVIGNELGAASKNVIGIAAGMLDGVGRSSLKGALMARGTREISKLIGVMGGDPVSAYGLCHLGDYEATLFSKHSRNRRFGEMFVKGQELGELAEGVSTARALDALSARTGVELPICRAVYDIIDFGKEPEEVLSNLFLRSLKNEF